MNAKHFLCFCVAVSLMPLACNDVDVDDSTRNDENGSGGVRNTSPTNSDSNPSSSETDDSSANLAERCVATGGEIVVGQCCQSVSDFPRSCDSTGACGCAPTYSKPVQLCECPEGCFDPHVGCR